MYRKLKLPNGITLILEPIASLKSVAMGFFIGTGSAQEQLSENGTAHFIEHMNFKGTARRTAREIAETLDLVGGKLNAYTSKEHTCYYTTVLDEHIDTSLDLLTDICFHSTYDEKDIEMEKKVVLEEIKMYEDSPDEIVHDLFVRQIWPDFNLGQPVIGSAAVISALTRKDCLAYRKTHYVPENMIVSVAGKFKIDEMIARITAVLGKIKSNGYSFLDQKLPVYKSGIRLIEKDTEQVHFCLGTRGLSYHDKRRYPLMVLSSILGGSMSSLLFQEIREKRGLVYSIYSYPLSFKSCGLFMTYAGTSLKNARQVADLILESIEKLRKDIPDKMIETAKQQIKGSLLLGLETSSSRMSWNGKSLFYYNRINEPREIIEIINRIDKAELEHLIDYCFNPSYYALTAIGPFKDDIFKGVFDL